MKLLTALCSCNGEPILSNQNAVSEFLIKRDENKSALIIPVRFNEKDIEAYVDEYNN